MIQLDNKYKQHTILELRNITKTFPGVCALDGVQFDLKAGEIHALMGENGAGKSTLINIITGIYQADEGEIYLEDNRVHFSTPREAYKAGIAAIYQHATSYPDLSVMENIFIGHEERTPIMKRILWKKMYQRAQDLLKKLGADFDAHRVLGTLSIAQQQMVEIAKALSSRAKIIIMDEPTSALTSRESEELYRIAEQLRDQGVAIIFVSHRFEDMYRLASRVTVFRDARYITTWNIDEVNNHDLIFAMVGREINQMYPKRRGVIGDPVLRVEELSQLGYFADINFDVCAGEILSFTGLVGAGRSEVFQALLGITKITAGRLYVDDKPVRIGHPSDAMKLGIGYLPEDRQLQGLILEWGVMQNITLANLNAISGSIWVNISKELDVAEKLVRDVDVKTVTVLSPVSSLSGGNQQKVVVAKLLAQQLKLIILDEPTKGVDVNAKSAIYHIMNELTNQGYAIIMISSEMPEVLGMSDRIIVMRNGRITETFENKNVTQEMILRASMATDHVEAS